MFCVISCKNLFKIEAICVLLKTLQRNCDLLVPVASSSMTHKGVGWEGWVSVAVVCNASDS